jgi:hypothetical protein
MCANCASGGSQIICYGAAWADHADASIAAQIGGTARRE